MRKFFILSLALLSTGHAQEEINIPGLTTKTLINPAIKDESLARTGLNVNEIDITDDQDQTSLQLTKDQTHEAKVWGLNLDEEKRYVLLMQNRSKIYYEGLHLTPIDILGLNARNESERNHFAELAARQEAQKVSKNIAWNNAFYKAYNKLFENVPVIGDFDPAPFSPYAHKPVVLNQGESLYLFIKENDAVKTILMMLTEALETTPNTQLHLMFLGFNETDIQLWANKHQIPKSLVSNQQITLNHGDLQYQAIKLDKKHTPLLLLSKNGSSSIVDLGRF